MTRAVVVPREEWTAWPPERQQRLLLECADDVHAGQPRTFAENLLVVENKVPGQDAATVQMRFTDNQEYYYRECFAGRTKARDPIYAVGDKARQAYHTVFWLGMGFPQFYTLPGGWNIALFAHHDKTLKVMLSYIDLMAEGMPEIAWQGMRKKYWQDDHKEIEFPNGAVNRIDVFSGESNTAPRGGRYQMALYSEGAHYRESYWQRVSTAMRGVQPIWDIWDTTRNGTLYPDTGNPNQHYVKVKVLENGERRGHLLRRFWFHDRANALPEGHPLARPGTEGGFALTEEEQALSRDFPKDGVPVLDRIRWRRSEIAAYIEDKGGNEKRGKAFFLQENLESPHTWANAENTPFDIDLINKYLYERLVPWRDDPPDIKGLKVQLMYGPQPGHDYGAGQDCAGGKKNGDLDSLSIVDAMDGNSRVHVGRLIGRVGSQYMAERGLSVLRDYHHPYWGIERNAGWGKNALDVAEASYPSGRIYRRPQEHSESNEHYRTVERGFLTTEASKNRIIQALIDDFNSGHFKTFFPETLHMFENYNPREVDHTPDEMISLAIANEAAKDRRVWQKEHAGVTGGSMRHGAASPFAKYNHGRRPAAPFALR